MGLGCEVFGFTTSTGKILAFLVPMEYTGDQWARDVTTKVAPFLKRCFPDKEKIRILLDGEKLLHTPEAKAALKRHGIEVLKFHGQFSNFACVPPPQIKLKLINYIFLLGNSTEYFGTDEFSHENFFGF